ncbi:membrane protein insertase YidC [Nocardiopsis algeriensis]|uniref:Membrane protein insertase YidC n=1 Tax=Nocardiopsis algeriensis TaxID=1478215 RepID=A0A841II93_9ACTN|nr:YidC/Oxa1 family membrane protein insertase [Nocardiopsis algeriensis]
MYSFWPVSAAMSLLTAVLTALTDALTPVAGGTAAALAVVALTVAVRLLLLPLGVAQVRAEKARARIAPRLAEAAARYRNTPEKLAAEQMKVYSEAGTSPLAGCLPSLAQIPVVIALYGVFIGAGEAPTPLLEHALAGVELGATAAAAGGAGAPVFVPLLALLAAVAWASRRYVLLPASAANPAPAPEQAGILRVMSYMPYTTVLFAAFVPLAAGLYLLASTAWTVGERVLLRRVVPAPVLRGGSSRR